MKAKKLLALGLLSAMAVTTLSTTGVSAAENAMKGTGATNVEYTPGRSSGGDGDGNVSTWTIDYPVKITLSDATVDAESGKEIVFKALKTSDGTVYQGDATITVTLANHLDKTTDNQSIKMKDDLNQAQANVTMQLSDKSRGVVKADGSGKFASLTKDAADYTLKAYLSDNSGAENKQTYKTKLTWVFESVAY